MAETRHLKPLGLDANSLLERQADFPRDFVAEMRHDLKNSPLEVETIIVGMDSSGPHIFVVSDPGIAECHDLMAFAAIGTGKHHASSQFMVGGFTRFQDWRKALLLTYIAKKRAEISPTVGSASDLFYSHFEQDGSASFQAVPTELLVEMDRIYRQVEDSIGWVTQQAFHDFGAFIDGKIHGASQQDQTLPEVTEKIPAPPPEDAPKPEASRPKKARSRAKRSGDSKGDQAGKPSG